MNAARASSPLRLATSSGLLGEALRLHELSRSAFGVLELLDDDGRFFDEPDFARLVGLCAGKKRDRGIDGVLLPAEVEDMAVRLGVVQHAIGAAERLN